MILMSESSYNVYICIIIPLIRWGMWSDEGIKAQPKESVRKMRRLMLLWHTEETNDIHPRAYRFSSVSYPKAVVFISYSTAVKCFPVPYTLDIRLMPNLEKETEGGSLSKFMNFKDARKWWHGGHVAKDIFCKWNVPHSVPKVKYFKLNNCTQPISPRRKQYSLYSHRTKGAGLENNTVQLQHWKMFKPERKIHLRFRMVPETWWCSDNTSSVLLLVVIQFSQFI